MLQGNAENQVAADPTQPQSRNAEKWSDEEIRALRRAKLEQNLDWQQVVATQLLPGRSPEAIYNKMVRLGLRPKTRFTKPWTIKEVRMLRRVVNEQGLGANRIFQTHLFPGRTVAAISNQMNGLGLGNPVASERSKKQERLSAEQKKTLLEFLRNGGRNMCGVDVAEKLGVSYGAVQYHRRKQGLTITRATAFNNSRFIEAHQDLLPKLYQGRKEFWRNYWKRKRELLICKFRELEAAGCQAKIVQCGICKDPWFASARFFYRARPRKDGSRGLRYYCRACGRPWKRGKKRRQAKKPGVQARTMK